MKTTIFVFLIGAFISIGLSSTAAQAEIKVGIAGDLTGSALTAGGMESDIGIIIRQAKKTLPNLRLISADGLVSPDFLRYAGKA
ncbi:MAG: hypothetical protein KJO26_07490, partial [Deltaproteobacteria bacterium]|nr:hypothetical protein [Deltaproteobacteria bacterium]